VAADHPVVGVGPDVFPVVFPRYAGDRFGFVFGPFTVANGAHNLFLNTLANLGAAGLVALLALLTAAGTHVWSGWREIGRDPSSQERRLVLAAVVAALVAYVVQACFNVQDLTLSLCFWALLGFSVPLAAGPGTARHSG
ncbi:MAG: hypothetical protein M3203_17400, partial [Actinomycetota bacterium]|nr:hypothetical protein [Actinomycetota bacterium]